MEGIVPEIIESMTAAKRLPLINASTGPLCSIGILSACALSSMYMVSYTILYGWKRTSWLAFALAVWFADVVRSKRRPASQQILPELD